MAAQQRAGAVTAQGRRGSARSVNLKVELISASYYCSVPLCYSMKKDGESRGVFIGCILTLLEFF